MKLIQQILIFTILLLSFNCETVNEQKIVETLENNDSNQENPLTPDQIDDQMTLITACWYLGSLKIKSEKTQMFQKFSESSHKNIDLFNKLQVDLIKECYGEITLQGAKGILSDLADLEAPEGTTYDRYVPNNTFSLEKYIKEDADLTLEESDQSLLQITKELEKDFLNSIETAKKSTSQDYYSLQLFGYSLNNFSYYFLIAFVGISVFLGLKMYKFANQSNVKQQKKTKKNSAKSS